MDPWIEATDSQTTHMQYGNETDNVFNKMCLDDNCIWTCVESVWLLEFGDRKLSWHAAACDGFRWPITTLESDQVIMQVSSRPPSVVVVVINSPKVSYTLFLIPRPLPDFISQLWRKSGSGLRMLLPFVMLTTPQCTHTHTNPFLPPSPSPPSYTYQGCAFCSTGLV